MSRAQAIKGALGCAAVWVAAVSAAYGQTYRPGDQVVVVATENLLSERTVVDKVWPGLTLKVEDVNGDWLRLNNGKAGWLKKQHVIPFDRAAIERLTAMIARDPRSASLYSGRAHIWRNLGEYDIAIADYNEALRLSPNAAAYYNNRGLAWRAKGDNDKAIADYNEAIRLSPNDAACYNNRGTAWRAKGDNDKAIADYNEAIRLDPKNVFAYNNRGNAWRAKGDNDKAIADFNEALRLDPKYVFAYHNRGIAWSNKGEYDKAVADCNEALRLDPKLAVAYNNRGVALCLQRKPAAEDFQRAIDLGDVEYAIILGHFAARLTDDTTPQAERFLSQGKNLKPDWPTPIVAFLRREIDEPALLKQATNNGQLTEAHGYLGLDHLAAGRTTEAREHLQWVVDQGNRGFIPYTIAVAELKRLDSK